MMFLLKNVKKDKKKSTYQILSDIFKQNRSNNDDNNMVNSTQVNQVGSFSTHFAHQVTDQPPTGNSSIKTIFWWVLDSGAINHVCVSLSHLVSYKPIKHVLINLPNGHHVLAKYFGTVVFNKKFFLSNVLYVPKFTFNLISVSKITSDLDCRLIFLQINVTYRTMLPTRR